MRKLLLFIITIALLAVLSNTAMGQSFSGITWDGYNISGQVVVFTGNKNIKPDTCAAFQIGKDTTTKGLLLPRVLDTIVTGQKKGLLIYRIADNKIYYHTGSAWSQIGGSGVATDSTTFITLTRLKDSLLKYVRRSDSNILFETPAHAANTYVPKNRTLTINGVTFDLSANRAWTIPGSIDSTTAGLWLSESSNQISVDTGQAAAYLLRRKDSSTYLTPTDAAVAYQPIGSYLSGTDTVSLSNRINQRVKYTDTANMLSPYFHTVDTANKWLPIGYVPPSIDTTSLSNRINLRVRYIDTAGMLANYQTNINARVKYIDTASILLPYLRKLDTASLSNRINTKLNITDTTNKWLPIGTTYLQTISKAGSTISLSNGGGSVVDDTLTNYVAGYGTIISGRLIRSDTLSTNGLATQYDLTQFPVYTFGYGFNVISGGGGSNTVNADTGSTGLATQYDLLQAGQAQTYNSVLANGNTATDKTAIINRTADGILYQGQYGGVNTHEIGHVGNGRGYVKVIDAGSGDFVTVTYTNINFNGVVATAPSVSGSLVVSSQIPTALPNPFAHTVNSTLSGSSYNGSSAQIWGLNLSNANQWLATQTFPRINFNQSAPITYTLGQVQFDSTCNCLTFDGNTSATRLNIGQELWENVYNNTGSTITAGSAVYITGGVTISGEVYATVALAQANSATTIVCIGLATENIANGARGMVTTNGTVHDINTSALSVGNVFVSATVAGGLTNTAPVSPNYRYRVGVVSSVNASTGTIKVTGSTAALGNGPTNYVSSISTTGIQEYHSAGGPKLQGVNPVSVNLLTTGSTAVFTMPAGQGDFIVSQVIITILSVTGTPAGTLVADIRFGTTAVCNISLANTLANVVGKVSRFAPANGLLAIPAGNTVSFNIGTALTTATVLTARIDVIGHYTN